MRSSWLRQLPSWALRRCRCLRPRLRRIRHASPASLTAECAGCPLARSAPHCSRSAPPTCVRCRTTHARWAAQALVFHGHKVDPAASSPESDPGLQRPHVVRGSFVTRRGLQLFARTDEVLSLGMCGGPVLDEQGKCVGMVEGIVPEDAGAEAGTGAGVEAVGEDAEFVRSIRGMAAFASARDLLELVQEVDAGQASN